MRNSWQVIALVRLESEKARKLHSDLLQESPSTNVESDEFKASQGWFDKFHKRSVIHSVIRHGEASSSDKATAEAYKKEFTEFMTAERYVTHKCSTAVKQCSSGGRCQTDLV